MSNKTTASDFKYFKERCEYWINIYNLKNWRIYYLHEQDDGTAKACIDYDSEAMTVALTLQKSWGSNIISKDELDKTAFHEVQEILLTKIHSIAQSRSYEPYFLEQARHEIIRIMENAVFPKLREKGKTKSRIVRNPAKSGKLKDKEVAEAIRKVKNK